MATETLQTAEATPGAEHTGAARVLVVDDNADMRKYVGQLLAQHWQVETVADGMQALEAARRLRPDLILSDVMMPVLDGFGLLRAVRQEPALAAIPIILLSARAGEESRIEGLEAGADDYLPKPFSARELVARVTTHLELSRLRRAAELERAKLHGLFMNAPAFICLLRGPQHVVEFANARYHRLIGRPDLIGHAVRELVPEADGQGYFELLDNVYQTGKPFIGNESRLLLDSKGTGELVEDFVNFVYQPYFGPHGEVEGISVFGFEVTELVRARKEAEGASRFAEQFVGILGHDLRNPLNSISMGAAVLRRKLDTTPEAKTIDRISSSTQRMGRMVEQLLDLTRGRLGGGIEIVRQPMHLSEVVTAALDELRAVHPARTLEAKIPAEIRGEWDADRLTQVVSNLVGNAIQHGDPARPVEVILDAPLGRATLSVRNYGAPIPAELMPVLFEPFRRGPRESGGRQSSGLGLGLYITEQIVHAHGGSIAVVSDDTATTFTVSFPPKAGAGS